MGVTASSPPLAIPPWPEPGEHSHCSTRSQKRQQDSHAAAAAADGDEPEKRPPPPPPRFPPCGVQLSFVADFIEECGGRDALDSMMTEVVCDMYVKRATAPFHASYVDVLRAIQHPAVARNVPQVYVVHSWKHIFLDVVDALQFHFRADPHVVVWFDVFCVNQHDPVFQGALHPLWLPESLKDGIRDIGRTVIALGSLDTLHPLKRTWCLYEMQCALMDKEARFEVAMSPPHLAKFIDEASRDDRTVLDKLWATLDVGKSQTTRPDDKVHLLAAIGDVLARQKTRSTVYDRLCAWMIAAMKTALQEETDVVNMVNLMHAVAQVASERGSVDEAEDWYKKSMDVKRTYIGEDHASVLNGLNGLASLYLNTGKFADAAVVYDECLEKRLGVLGDRHPGTYSVLYNRALVHVQQNQLAEAEELLVACVRGRRDLLGRSNADTLESVNLLAVVYANQDPPKFTRAEKMYNDCLKRRRETLGDTHPTTLSTMHNLALLYDAQKMYDDAEALFRECVERKTAVLGALDPSTLRSVHAHAMCFFHQERWEVAESMLFDCMEQRKEALGPKHVDTAVTMGAYADSLYHQRKYNLAQPIYVNVVVAVKENYGGNHPRSVKAVNDLRQCRSFLY